MYNLCLIFNIDNYLFFKLYISIIGNELGKFKEFLEIFFEYTAPNFFSKIDNFFPIKKFF